MTANFASPAQPTLWQRWRLFLQQRQLRINAVRAIEELGTESIHPALAQLVISRTPGNKPPAPRRPSPR